MITKNIFIIIGSTSANSSNLKLIKQLQSLTRTAFDITIFEGLVDLPHFNPDLDHENPPEVVKAFRQQIAAADAVIICTPEYVFSLPGSLKNALEWCVSTTIFSKKPVGLITAAAHGEKAHEALQLVMKTIESNFTEATTLLIKGIKGKFDADGNLTDQETLQQLTNFSNAFQQLIST